MFLHVHLQGSNLSTCCLDRGVTLISRSGPLKETAPKIECQAKAQPHVRIAQLAAGHWNLTSHVSRNLCLLRELIGFMLNYGSTQILPTIFFRTREKHMDGLRIAAKPQQSLASGDPDEKRVSQRFFQTRDHTPRS